MPKTPVRLHNGHNGTARHENRQLVGRTSEFDYGCLASSIRDRIATEAAAIRTFLHRTAENIIQVGFRLNQIHAILGRKRFQGWIASELGWSQSTASNYMRAADKFYDVKCLDRLHPSALFELARKKASNDARTEALRRAMQGEVITKPVAQLIINAHSHRQSRQKRAAGFRAARALRSIDQQIPAFSHDDAERIRVILSELLTHIDAVLTAKSTMRQQK